MKDTETKFWSYLVVLLTAIIHGVIIAIILFALHLLLGLGKIQYSVSDVCIAFGIYQIAYTFISMSRKIK